VKGGLGLVADQVGHLGEGCAGVPQPLHRNLHAPTREVVHWRHADQADEAVGQRLAREAGLAAEVVDGPGPREIVVDQREGARDMSIAQSRKPSGLALRQGFDITAHSFDEQQFRQLGQHGLRSGTAGGHLFGSVLEGRADPLRCPALPQTEFEHRRQGRNHWIAFGTVTAEKAADRSSAAYQPPVKLIVRLSFGRGLPANPSGMETDYERNGYGS